MSNGFKRSVLITGGGTGIGREIALAFADIGDAVTIVGCREEALRTAVAGTSIQYPSEVAATAVFLASDGAASINGHALSVSGGEV